jgi:hypothetical protein
MKTLEPRKERVIITVIKPGIVNNTWRGELMTQDQVVHELIHAIDMCRTKMDPFTTVSNVPKFEQKTCRHRSFFKAFLHVSSCGTRARGVSSTLCHRFGPIPIVRHECYRCHAQCFVVSRMFYP